MYIRDIHRDITLHRDIKHFCCYCLQSFGTAQILERLMTVLKINANK